MVQSDRVHMVLNLIKEATEKKERLSSWDISVKLDIRADLTMEILRLLQTQRKIIKRGTSITKWYESL